MTTLESEGRVVDTQSDNIGFRFFSVDPDKGFFLNGEHLQLKGVCRHQDRTEIGNAITELHHIEDMDIMLEMGVNAMRLAHYPQDKYFYDLCDKYGIVVWAEIPFIGPGGYRASGFVDQEPFRENGIQQLRELIRQNYNHPSICFWGLFNELKLDTDNPCEYLNELNEIAHAEDATRLTTSASHLDKNDDPEVREINSITDLIAWNKYYGWYGYDASRIIEWLDKTRADYPGRSICLSEYGAGASIIHQSEELIKADPTSRWHPENWQTHFHEQYWAAIDTRPYLWATFVWNMFDFGAAHRTEGEINGKNDKGLVTFDRHVKKDAFYFYKANWNEDDKFVYIAERRLLRRSTKPQTFKVFSNESDIELIVNGVSLGKRKGTYGTFVWEGVELQSGENTITAKSRKLSDEIVIFRD